MGETVTGNTTMLLEEGLDTGPILLQQRISIAPAQTAVELFEELSRLGAPLVVETLAGLAEGTLRPQPQDDSQATLARILDREDGRMDFAAHTATELWNRWRGFQQWPGAFTALDGKKLIVHRLRPVPAFESAEPGEILIQEGILFVACAGGTVLELLELQPEGRNRMTAAEFLRGNPVASGKRLG
jgi:methionyl-tRNA formyltransferase